MGTTVDGRRCDIAKNLDQLYDFMVNQITQANHKNDPQMLDDVIEIIRE
ncbi:flagellar export chaperone FliS, partial [Vibrio cholerae]